MAWVVVVGGQKGGSGKSTIAQGLAVEATRHGSVVILADMDRIQQTSLRWGERRKIVGVEPAIDVRLLRSIADIESLGRLCDLVVVDTPGRADRNTLNLARAADLMVLSSDTNAFELEPTVMVMQALKKAGIDESRLAVVLSKVLDHKREATARSYLRQVGCEALPVSIKFHPLAHDVGNEGRAVTEARQRGVAKPAKKFFDGIVAALNRAVELGQHKKLYDEGEQEQDR